MDIGVSTVIKQHLIDPESCIRCNTCEDTCPQGAITHSDNYVVDVDKCTHCGECLQPCPTGAIDNHRKVPRAIAYSVQDQLGWHSLPDALTAAELAAAGVTFEAEPLAPVAPGPAAGNGASMAVTQYSATVPPWSAAHAYTKLYDASNPVTATVTGNMRVTQVGREYDTHSIVLDLGNHRYALYAHMQPGSLKVHKGDHVKAGQVIGLVGNTGNSLVPHLHFHVMDSPSPLASNGLPYEIRSFEVTGHTPGTQAFDEAEAKGTPLSITPTSPPAKVTNAMPLDQLLVTFP